MLYMLLQMCNIMKARPFECAISTRHAIKND